jgi:hypothetical protein
MSDLEDLYKDNAKKLETWREKRSIEMCNSEMSLCVYLC